MAKYKQISLAILFIYITYANAFIPYHSVLPRWYSKNGESKAIDKSARSWVDRQACRWLRACQSIDWLSRILGGTTRHVDQQSVLRDFPDVWNEGRKKPEEWKNDSRIVHAIPQYVLDHAPLVHLFSGEKFWPCDMAEHLFHVTPNLNYTPIQSRTQLLNLTNLDELNKWDNGRFIYLTSNDNVEQRPDWLGGQKNIPDLPDDPDQQQRNDRNGDNFLLKHEKNNIGLERFRFKPNAERYFGAKFEQDQGKLGPKNEPDHMQNSVNGGKEDKIFGRDAAQAASDEIKKRQLAGRSDAPAILIVVNKGRGIVDAFWFFFYSYNLGNMVFNVRFGNHIGDWEHTLVRFVDGKPRYVYFSEHNFGEAYSYGAVEKIGKRVRYWLSHNLLYSF